MVCGTTSCSVQSGTKICIVYVTLYLYCVLCIAYATVLLLPNFESIVLVA